MKTTIAENRIWEYELRMIDTQLVPLPDGHQIIAIQPHGDSLYLWAIVNPDEKKKRDVIVEIYGTGHTIFPLPTEKDGQPFLGQREYFTTVQMERLVWHIFIIK